MGQHNRAGGGMQALSKSAQSLHGGYAGFVRSLRTPPRRKALKEGEKSVEFRDSNSVPKRFSDFLVRFKDSNVRAEKIEAFFSSRSGI